MNFFTAKAKQIKWTPSKIKSGIECPLRFNKELNKAPAENYVDDSDARIGSATHHLMEALLVNPKAASNPVFDSLVESKFELVTQEFEMYKLNKEPAVKSLKRIQAFAEKNGLGIIDVEKSLALDEHLKPVAYKDPTAIIRGRIDLAMTDKQSLFVVLDHKTGMTSMDLTKHNDQLMAYLLMYGHSRVLGENGDFDQCLYFVNYLGGQSDIVQSEPITKGDFKEKVIEFVVKQINMCAKLQDKPIAKPGDYCRYCPYIESCPEKKYAQTYIKVKK